MRDLNATMFYKAKFNITAKDPDNCDLLWKVILEIRTWITQKMNRLEHSVVEENLQKWSFFKSGGKLYDLENRNTFFAESVYHKNFNNEQISWACIITEKPSPEFGYAPREWTTEIGYQSKDKASATISYVITYNDAPGFIGPCMEMPDITVPKVIFRLLSDNSLNCNVGDLKLQVAPEKLIPGEYPFFEQLLFDPNRELPILYISPKRKSINNDETLLLVSAQKALDAVTGNALVFYSSDMDFSKEMSYMGKDNYNCTGGALRIYFPHVNSDNTTDHYRHRFISAKEIEKNGETYALQILRRALAQDVHYYETMFRIESCNKLLYLDINNNKIEMLRLESEGNINEAITAYLTESNKRLDAEQKFQKCEAQIADKNRDICSLTMQLDSLRETVDHYKMIESANHKLITIKEFPDTPIKLAQYFEILYPNRIIFTQRGYRSLENCITKVDLLWEAFYYIANDLYDLLKMNPATAFKKFKEKTGWDCSRGEGRETRKDSKLMQQYVDEYNKQEIDIEPHIKKGTKDSDSRSVRIYFAYDPTIAPGILIGHCGKHLDNYSTKKIK